jgi:hypothetical protein
VRHLVEAGRDDRALEVAGAYRAVRDGIPGFGSAGDATLEVRGLSSPVPEPASAGLLLLGALALGVTSRRRQR